MSRRLSARLLIATAILAAGPPTIQVQQSPQITSVCRQRDDEERIKRAEEKRARRAAKRAAAKPAGGG